MSTFKTENRLTSWNLVIALIALFIGGALGPLQKLQHANRVFPGIDIDFYPVIGVITGYYQGLTVHGVLNALIWTTFFIIAFFSYAIPRSLKHELTHPRVHWAAYILMTLGLVSAAIPLLTGRASVLYTFYPPLQADTLFYVGLVLVVVGSWTAGYGFFFTYSAWRRENPDVRTPLIALGSLINMAMWQIATLGVASEILFQIIPWTLGWVEGIDPQLARTFFWFFGHPLVYFWLLPAYVSWYGMLPKQAGGTLFSEPLARLVFWLFLALSIPVGVHHQYTDPGVPAGWKVVHAILTYSLFIPSLMTAFTVVASLETGARARGGTGLLGWVRALPWNDPSYTAQNLAMILFAFGGISGLTNSSYNVNLAVHNTMWVPGHFHLTLGSAVTLSFMGICYWLIPALTGKKLFSPRIGLYQAWTWFAGMLLMSNALSILGLNLTVPRRSMLGAAPYAEAAWNPFLIESLIGGLILGISGLLFYTNVIGTVFASKPVDKPVEMPVAVPADPTPAPAWLDTWRPWLALTVALILVAYGPLLVSLISNMSPVTNGITP